MSLPTGIYTAEQVRALDRHAIEACGIPGYTLMNRAATAAFDVLLAQWPLARRVLVLCGSGNNGGDGYVLARLAHAAGLDVVAIALAPRERLRDDALQAYEDAEAAGVSIRPFNIFDFAGTDVVVDAMFGTGLDRPVDPAMNAVIERVNRCGLPVLSLDVPSGLHADTGHVMGGAVRASHTVSFVGMKLGCHVGQGPAYCGQLHFSDLGIPPRAEEIDLPALERLDPALLSELLLPRARDAHKGLFGHVLVVGGGLGMPGAVRLSAEACLRSGAGLVSVATRGRNVDAVIAGRPELMVHSIDDVTRLEELLLRADLVVLGPGLGRDAWAEEVFATAMAADKPMVVDADALNLLAARPVRREDWILTPHPGEAARLLITDVPGIQEDRLSALFRLVDRYGGVAVLKGAGTLIGATGRIPCVCPFGNPGMATAGMGDVLTGVIGGLLAQSLDPWSAARAGVLAHALAGDRAAQDGERGLVASDLFGPLRACLNPVR
ncbi:MAG TPA: NAD(P)H-hydrate dehydratase [Steroidobacteraceae bacterium]|nr:NAD(P)H-hydrate dehydratase [Steroidobacteraceae bacterium]